MEAANRGLAGARPAGSGARMDAEPDAKTTSRAGILRLSGACLGGRLVRQGGVWKVGVARWDDRKVMDGVNPEILAGRHRETCPGSGVRSTTMHAR